MNENNISSQMKIFFPDTNLLYNIADAKLRESNNEVLEAWHRKSLSFWRREGKNTVIPTIVWNEFLSTWFQKDINYLNYDMWFNFRYTSYSIAYKALKEFKVKFSSDKSVNFYNVYQDSKKLTLSNIPKGLVKKISEKIGNEIVNLESKANENSTLFEVIERKKKNLCKGKLLDGLDAVIISYIFEVAKLLPSKLCVFVSSDQFIIDTIEYIQKENNGMYNDLNIPPNVTAIRI